MLIAILVFSILSFLLLGAWTALFTWSLPSDEVENVELEKKGGNYAE